MMRRKLRQGKPRCNGSSGPMGGAASVCRKSLAEFRRPKAAKENKIVFPAACTSEKHFARSERRIVRHRRTTEAQSAARPLWRKRRQPFSTVLERPRGGAAFSVAKFPLMGYTTPRDFRPCRRRGSMANLRCVLHGKIKTRGTMEEKKTVQTEVEKPRDRAVLAGLSSPRLDKRDNADEDTLEELGAPGGDRRGRGGRRSAPEPGRSGAPDLHRRGQGGGDPGAGAKRGGHHGHLQ